MQKIEDIIKLIQKEPSNVAEARELIGDFFSLRNEFKTDSEFNKKMNSLICFKISELYDYAITAPVEMIENKNVAFVENQISISKRASDHAVDALAYLSKTLFKYYPFQIKKNIEE